MKILQLCHKVPFPPKDGGCIAMNNLAIGLMDQGCDIKVLAINTQKHFVDVNVLPVDYLSKTRMEGIFVDTEVKVTSAFLNLFSNRSYNIERFYSKAFENKLINVLKEEKFDIVQLESIYVSMYVAIIRKHSNAKIVLRAHNIEHALWEYNATLSANPIKKLYLKLLATRLKHYELKISKAVDAIIPITKQDETYFKKMGFSKAMATIPFGIDLTYDPHINSQETDPDSIFHIGSMDWQPNVDGIQWFLDAIWNKLHAQYPRLHLFLAGRGMSTQLKQLKIPNVIILGEVESTAGFMLSKGLMIVPLRSGSGMRVKIVEAMALGKTIISTSIGAEGIEYENNINILIADTPDAFVEAIGKCLNDKAFAEKVGNNAKLLVETKYNNKIICKKLVGFYQAIMNEKV